MNLKDEIGKSKVLLTASSDRLLAGYGDGFSSFFVCTFGRVQVRSLFGQNESLLEFAELQLDGYRVSVDLFSTARVYPL